LGTTRRDERKEVFEKAGESRTFLGKDLQKKSSKILSKRY